MRSNRWSVNSFATAGSSWILRTILFLLMRSIVVCLIEVAVQGRTALPTTQHSPKQSPARRIEMAAFLLSFDATASFTFPSVMRNIASAASPWANIVCPFSYRLLVSSEARRLKSSFEHEADLSVFPIACRTWASGYYCRVTIDGQKCSL